MEVGKVSIDVKEKKKGSNGRNYKRNHSLVTFNGHFPLAKRSSCIVRGGILQP